MSTKTSYYRQLAAANRLIANTRECIDRQETVVIARADRGGEYGESVRLLRNLKLSLRLLVQSRAMIIKQLMRWPNYHR